MRDKTHSFHLEDIDKYGSMEKAIIMKEIKSMNLYKIRNNKGAWVFYSSKALAEKFPYMNMTSIRRWLTELEKDGHLMSVVDNKTKYDKTKSYLVSELKEFQTLDQNGQSGDQNGQSGDQNGQPIPPHSTTHSTPHSLEKAENIEINSVINAFKEVNPSYDKFFANKTQRSAVKRMVNRHGADSLVQLIENLPRTNDEKYAPTIMTPLELEDKIGRLLIFLKGKKEDDITVI